MKAFWRELGILLFATMPMTVICACVGFRAGVWWLGLVFPAMSLPFAFWIARPAVRR